MGTTMVARERATQDRQSTGPELLLEEIRICHKFVIWKLQNQNEYLIPRTLELHSWSVLPRKNLKMKKDALFFMAAEHAEIMPKPSTMMGSQFAAPTVINTRLLGIWKMA